MRTDVTKTNVYPFGELTEEAQDKAIESLAYINLEHEWWESIYEDAAAIGLKITSFDIDRGAYCKGEWTEDAEDVARLIIENHGETCETHKDAVNFLETLRVGKMAFEAMPDYDAEYEEYNESGGYVEHQEVFQYAILEDYRIMLQKDYEHLSSRETIIETIEMNEYEFTIDGKLF